jgi:hypothetical protein
MNNNSNAEVELKQSTQNNTIHTWETDNPLNPNNIWQKSKNQKSKHVGKK